MHLFCRTLTLILLVGLPLDAVVAQHAAGLQLPKPQQAPQTEHDSGAPAGIHVTDDADVFPNGVEALRAYHDALRSGTLPLGKGAAVTDTVGAQQDFNVRTNILEPGTNDWEAVTFVLRAKNDVANVWVASDLTSAFSDADLADLEAYILRVTPEDSYRPDHGIVENNNDTFGNPPLGLDGNRTVDVLMHDIEEGEENGCCVLGYVTRTDLNPAAPDGHGNRSNILYVDLPDGMASGGVFAIASTMAHEYQHLIHYEYSRYTEELTFVNEGLSEWAEVINGFFTRPINYLTNTDEHNTRLFAWRRNQSTTVVNRDYQRAGLFTTYIADRIGREATGSIVRARCPSDDVSCVEGTYVTGEKGYAVVLAENELTFPEVLADFNAANIINDRSYGDRFGYSLEQRKHVRAVPTEIIDGDTQSPPSMHGVRIQLGAFRYLSWTSVTDLHLQIDDADGAGADNRSTAALRLFLESEDGSAAIVDLEPDAREYVAEGAFDRATLILSHVKPTDADDLSDPNHPTVGPLQLDVTASWEGQADYSAESVAYDSGENSDQMFYGLSAEDMQANRFDVPPNARLASVQVAPLYFNQFLNGPDDQTLAKDFKLIVWDDDGTGRPGSEIYVQDVEESASTSHINSSWGYIFKEIELPDSDPNLSGLPPRIYIGLANQGLDENVIVLATAPNTTDEEVSFWYHASHDAWKSIAERDSALVDQAIPIRARFLIPTAVETNGELPTEVTLAQNYPNPFNPTTSVSYSLPRAMDVRLTVYNMLGKRVATLVDGLRSAGAHETRIDATGWASGVYVYALETEARTLTQRMVVLK